jgi:hypothetical protein
MKTQSFRLRAERIHSLGLFLLLLISYVYVLPRWADPNQDSRLKMVVAVVEDGSFQIDKYLGTTVDYAKVNGHYYSDKAPGVAFLGIPIYAVVRGVFETPLMGKVIERLANSPSFQSTLKEDGSGVQETKVRFALAQVVIALIVGAIPTAILGVLIFQWLERLIPVAWPRMLLAVSYGLLTPAFAYANTLYGHQLSAALLFGAFYIISRDKKPLNIPALLSVGVLLAYSVVTEYPTALVVGILFFYAFYRLYRQGQWLNILWVIATAAPIALGWMLYNKTIFGGPFNLGYSYSELWVKQHSTGFMSLTLPSFSALWGITFGVFRGLFVLAPWLLFSLPGFAVWWQEKRWRAEWWVITLSVIAMYFFNASSDMWWGGFSIGPRYILPSLPFLILPIAGTLSRWGKTIWGQVVFGFTILWAWIATWGLTLAGQSFPSDAIPNPLWAYAIPNWQSGNIARNLGIFLGFKGISSLFPLLVLWTGVGLLWWVISRRWGQTPQVESNGSVNTTSL